MLFPNEIYSGRRLFSLTIKDVGKYTVVLVCDCGKQVECQKMDVLMNRQKDCGCGEGDKIHKCTPQSGYKPLVTPNGRFDNPKDAAEVHCLAVATITRRCNSPQWGSWQWTSNLASQPNKPKYNGKEIITPFGSYRSISECAEANNMGLGAVKYRLNSCNYPDWKRN